MAKVIFENELEELATQLAKNYRVIVPVLEHDHSAFGKIVFKEYEKGQKLAFSYPTTNLPPKEFLLPPQDVLFAYEKGEVVVPKSPKTVLFGLSVEDLEGLDFLKKVFEKPVPDKPYLEKTENTYIVGLDHFSPPRGIGFDLYLQKIKPDTYASFAKTPFGRKLASSKLFETHNLKVPKVNLKKDVLIWDPDLPEIIEKSRHHPIWKELAQICFGCGICSFTCPLCYCTDTEDTVELPPKDLPSGVRQRTWDSCMLSNFAEISNHNFRPELADRIYNWYYHKFTRMPREYGFPGCVDCRRCTIFCPAKINYRSVLERLKRDYKPKGKK